MDCGVCSNSLLPADQHGLRLTLLDCGHAFHYDCAETQLRQGPGGPSCPTCKQPHDTGLLALAPLPAGLFGAVALSAGPAESVLADAGGAAVKSVLRCAKELGEACSVLKQLSEQVEQSGGSVRAGGDPEPRRILAEVKEQRNLSRSAYFLAKQISTQLQALSSKRTQLAHALASREAELAEQWAIHKTLLDGLRGLVRAADTRALAHKGHSRRVRASRGSISSVGTSSATRHMSAETLAHQIESLAVEPGDARSGSGTGDADALRRLCDRSDDQQSRIVHRERALERLENALSKKAHSEKVLERQLAGYVEEDSAPASASGGSERRAAVTDGAACAKLRDAIASKQGLALALQEQLTEKETRIEQLGQELSEKMQLLFGYSDILATS